MYKDKLAPITVPCPHDCCLTMVAYHNLNDYKTACPYSLCSCTEVGCIFTTSPVTLLIHLDDDHKVQVHRISLGHPMKFTVAMLLPSFLSSILIIYGDDASLFSLIISDIG